MKRRIYLDHNASTPLDPSVLQAITHELEQELGNPSSVHYFGKQCKSKLEQSREAIASYLNIKPYELIFTSGGTEGANLLLRGFLSQHGPGHIITSNAEHSAVYNTLKKMEKSGTSVTYLHAGLYGAATPEQVKQAITPKTMLITLMAVNNETGVKTDVEAIAAIAHEAGIPFIVDGVALLGKEPFTIPAGVSAMFFSAHKLHGPKGIGAVFSRSSCRVDPMITGGNQEYGRRGGTENLAGIVGFAKAIELLTNQDLFTAHIRTLRDKLENELKFRLGDIVVVNGEGPRVCNTSNISFSGVDGESLLLELDMAGIAVSHGSACASGAIEPSRILLNMGIPLERARSALRFSVSRMTTAEEVDAVVEAVVKIIQRRFK